MKKLLLFIILLGITFLNSFNKTYASENFTTSYAITYKVNEDQTTRVSLQIDLKNKTTNYFASSYALQLGYKDIKNIVVDETGQKLDFKNQENNKGRKISFNFQKKAVGINKVERFTVSFDTNEITKKYGNIWEVNIPGVSNQDNYDAFSVTVNTPKTFGEPSYIKPSVNNLKSSKNNLYFTKEDLGKGGVSIAYGEFQVYDFNLKYNLYNKNLFPTTTEIALPSNNNYQNVKIDDINPKPIDVHADNDGNWLASYKLNPSQKIIVSVKGQSKISLKPNVENLSETQKNLYLKQDKYWEVDNKKVQDLAKNLKTPQAIYNYVVDNLKYDSSRVRETQVRAGALGVLNDKNSAVCLEFSDFFVALARAAGIPARAIEGYANTNNSAERPLSLEKDVLHAWAEYYDFDKKAWVMVDPTWQNTTHGIDYFNVFDFDHFAFVIKGEQSDYPVPAGGYKFPGKENVKDVNVTVNDQFNDFPPTVEASTDFSKKYIAGFPIDANIIITNTSGVTAPKQSFSVTSQILSPNNQNLFFDEIPPYGKRSIPVKFNSRPFLTNESDTIKIKIGNSSFDREIQISPFYKSLEFYLGAIIIGSFAIAVSIFAYGSRRLHLS